MKDAIANDKIKTPTEKKNNPLRKQTQKYKYVYI